MNRYEREDIDQVPLVPWFPATSILVNTFLTMKLSWQTWVILSWWCDVVILWCHVDIFYKNPKHVSTEFNAIRRQAMSKMHILLCLNIVVLGHCIWQTHGSNPIWVVEWGGTGYSSNDSVMLFSNSFFLVPSRFSTHRWDFLSGWLWVYWSMAPMAGGTLQRSTGMA